MRRMAPTRSRYDPSGNEDVQAAAVRGQPAWYPFGRTLSVRAPSARHRVSVRSGRSRLYGKGGTTRERMRCPISRTMRSRRTGLADGTGSVIEPLQSSQCDRADEITLAAAVDPAASHLPRNCALGPRCASGQRLRIGPAVAHRAGGCASGRRIRSRRRVGTRTSSRYQGEGGCRPRPVRVRTSRR